MSKVASENPDKPNEPAVSVNRLADTVKSDAHVSQLLHIADHCSKHLCWRLDSGETMDMNETVTKECKQTFELVHLQLRNLVDEQRRWSLELSESEREQSKLIESTLGLYAQKTENAKIYNRPAIFLRPKIGHFDQGWFVWIGGEGPTTRDLFGRGDSPSEAMDAFDKAYYGLREATEKQEPQKIKTRSPRKPQTRTRENEPRS